MMWRINKQLKNSTYYAHVAEMGTIGEHHRQETQPEDDEPKASGTTKDVIYAQRHNPSVVSAGDITGHCDWQTFLAQSSKTIYADIFITRCMYLSDKWEMPSKCWQARLLPKRCVVKVKAGRGQPDEIVMVVGLMANKVVIGWKLETVNIPKSKFKIFLVGGRRVLNTVPCWFTVIGVTQLEIIPTTVISPLNYFLVMKKKLPDRIGVVLMQHGLPLHVHLAAARAAFYDLQLPQLTILVHENRIPND